MASTLQIDRYEVVETLGCGASSRVAKARDSVIGRTVALKTFVQGFGEGCEQQFLREAQIVGQLSHPTIVHLYDVGTDEQGTSHLVMEYVAGRTLEHTLEQGAIPLRRACAWAADLASALAAAHSAGIIHGDVKPGNIFITEDGKVKLGDFGIARLANQISGSGRVMGTPAYLSPEQIRGEKQDQRSDLFSLGVVLYEMVLGVRPFDGTSLPAVCSQILNAQHFPPSHCNPALPIAFDHVIARCLAKNPAERFQNGEELARALYPLARASKPAAPRPPAPWLARPFQFRDFWIAALALLALTAGATLSHSLYVRFQIPAAPSLLSQIPKAPFDLFGYSRTIIIASSADEAASTPQIPAQDSPTAATHSARHRPADVKAKMSARASAPEQTLLAALPVMPVVLSSASLNPAPAHVERAELQIDIASATDGTLAIFADQKLILTTELHNGSGDPLHLQRTLSPGPHQLRVALYRPNKSLQAEKEGLSELRSDATNTLGIRINRRSKLLLRRDPSLEVAWPTGFNGTSTHASAIPPESSALLK